MSEATLKAVKAAMQVNNEKWMANAAPSLFLLEGFYDALRILISNDAIPLTMEFAEELCKNNSNLRDAYIREEGPDGVPDRVDEMQRALLNYINRLKGNCAVMKAQPPSE